MTRRFVVSLLWLGVAIGVAEAQTPDTPQEEPPPKILRFYYLSYSGPDMPDADPSVNFLYQNDKQTARLRLAAHSLSEPIEYRGPVPIALFREVQTERGMVREPIGELDFPVSWSGVVFLVVPTREPRSALPFRFVPVEYGGPSLEVDHVRVVNLCASQMAARIADAKGTVPTRGHEDFGFPTDADSLFVRLALRNGERWRTVMSSLIPVPASRRLLMLAVPGDLSGDASSARIISIITVD